MWRSSDPSRREARRVTLTSRIRALHRRLLPSHLGIGWTPYLWLAYLSFFVVRLVLETPPPTELALAILSLLFFLVLYFDGFWHTGWRLALNIAAIVTLGIVWTPSNAGAMTFFIFGAAFCGSLGPPRIGWTALGAVAAITALAGDFFDRPWLWTLISVLLAMMVGASNIHFVEAARRNADLRRSREQVEQLAAVAERERIARDLHDLLGHTLSLITIKAELARKLSERGDPRAAHEIADVEKISRDALGQVREAVTGFRRSGLDGELARAHIACEARDITLEAIIDPVSLNLDPRHETTLAMVLREAVTNVVRHSDARRCLIELERAERYVVLRVEDDGRGRKHIQRGQGLIGMDQRLEALGGSLDIDGSQGWRLTASLPAEPRTPGEPHRAFNGIAKAEGLAT